MKSFLMDFLLVVSVTSLYAAAEADPLMPDVVDIAITKAYLPQGFDSNDRVELLIEGFLPNTCYRIGNLETKIDEQTGSIAVSQHAYLYNGLCLQILVPFHQKVELGILKNGTYQVTDGHSGKVFGKIPVKQALNDGPDDYFYGMVDDAHLGVLENERAVMIRGHVPSTCWFIKEVKTIVESDDVITILPIMDYDHNPPVECVRVHTPFFKGVKLPSNIARGKYLIHVRSLNGLSVNKLMNL